ncbi:MAG: hypothetical protein ABR497_00365 [Kiritimatiellia bacterium]|nr:hypothetical protein [Lentisphaerota bacterium]
MNDNMLTATGVIATILSLIFAAAAIWNSRVRRNQMEQAKRSDQPEIGAINFAPMPPPTHEPAAGTKHAPKQPASPPQALFRQVKPGTGTPVDVDIEKDNLYVWE